MHSAASLLMDSSALESPQVQEGHLVSTPSSMSQYSARAGDGVGAEATTATPSPLVIDTPSSPSLSIVRSGSFYLCSGAAKASKPAAATEQATPALEAISSIAVEASTSADDTPYLQQVTASHTSSPDLDDTIDALAMASPPSSPAPIHLFESSQDCNSLKSEDIAIESIDQHRNMIQDKEGDQPLAYVNCHIGQSTVVDDEVSVAQMRIVFPKSLSSIKETHSRKSPSLPPLKTTPTLSSTTRTTSLSSTTTSTATVTASATTENTTSNLDSVIAAESADTSSIVLMTTRPPSQDIPGSITDNISGSGHSHGIWTDRDPYTVGYDSTCPPSTAASSPTDYFSPYILPPIPSFSEIGLTFDKIRTRSTDSTGRRHGDASVNDRSHDAEPSRESLRQAQQTPEGSRTFHGSGLPHRAHNGSSSMHHNDMDEFVPDYDPSIFDHIQSDDNEAYILWSTPSFADNGINAAGSSTSPSFATDPNSAAFQTNTGSNSKHASLPSSTKAAGSAGAGGSAQPIAHQLPLSEPSSSVSSVKRWSAGEAFKGRDKGRDSFENDRAHAQKYVDGGAGASTPDVIAVLPKSNVHPSSTSAPTGADISSPGSTSPTPLSPGFSKPLERLSGTISIIRPVHTAVPPSKGASANTIVANSTASFGSPETRVIMAATVEKLVEKLTSDIDYTFLTDFFLIYRLFISPLALLKLLIARFHWALTEDTPQRMIVRVRTFVTMRHWLLNYFEYDFMGSKVLRRTLVQSLKALAEHPIVNSSVRDDRIVKELRRLFQLKRKIHCREMTQMALERPATRQSQEPSRQSSQRRHPTNLEWTQYTTATSSKRSSVETSGTKQTRFQQATSMQEIAHQQEQIDGARSSAEEPSDHELELSSSGSQSDDDMYEEEAHFMIHRGEQQDEEQASDDETDDTDLDYDSQDEDQNGLSNSGHLPSPAFSTGSAKSKRPQQDYMSQGMSDNSTELVFAAGCSTKPHHHHPSHLHSPEASDHAPHHHRSHTVPRTHDARTQPRPLSYVDASMESSSSFAISPPESPRPLEPYINPPPRSIMSADKKKTWSQYVVATVEQLSKVKRVFMPKSSQSIQDLRHHSTSSTSLHSYIINTGGSVSRGSGGQEFAGMGYIIPSSSSNSTAKYWSNEDRIFYSDNGAVKVSQPSTAVNSNTATNSVVSSADGRRFLREDAQHVVDQTYHRDDWMSDDDEVEEDEDVQSESTGRSHDHIQRGRTSHTLQDRLVDGDHRLWQPSRANGGAGHLALDEEYSRQQPSTPTTQRRRSLPLDGLVTVKEVIHQQPGTLGWDDEEDEEEEDEDEDFSSLSIAPPSSNRALRRTVQKRDHRASWMTYSSTNSSVFGAVLSQGHLPPSQTLKDRSDVGNVDRFMERLYSGHGSNGTPEPTTFDGPAPVHRYEARRRSSEAIISCRLNGSNADKALFPPGSRQQEARENAFDSSASPGMSSRRSRTLAQHPHRQTVPIMHHHYHHHYLQHRQSESLLHEYPAQRRHSAEVQSIGAWATSQQSKERKNGAFTSIHGVSAIAGGFPHPGSRTLLEGAAYAAALQETQRQLRLLISNQDNQQSGRGSVQAPRVLPHPVGRPQGQMRPRPLATLSANSALQASQPNINVATTGQTRSTSDPHLLHMAATPESDSNSQAATTVKPAPRSNPTSRGVGVYRIHSPLYNHGSQAGSYPHHSHESSYNQQRSPMNPRFQSIISPTREYSRPPPSSMVLRYRSELIAQQLCLIEREQLNQVPWYELVNAGWKKKSPEAEAEAETEAASSSASSAVAEGSSAATAVVPDGDRTESGGWEGIENILEEKDLNPQAATAVLSRRAASPWPLSRSQTAKTHTQRFPNQGHTKDSPSVTQLVDRFNLMCHWVTSEILKTTDLEMRVKVVEKFIRIAQTCYNHSNFSSLTQIMLALQVHEVSRLSRTWVRVRSQEMRTMRELEEFTSMLHNWKQLRNAMKNIADEWGGATGAAAAATAAAATVGQDGHGMTSSTPPSTPGGGGSKHQSLSLFSKMAGKDKDKHQQQQQQQQQQHTSQTSNGVYSRQVSHNHSSSFGKSSGQSMTTPPTAMASGSGPGHHKTISGPVFPSLVSSLTNKDRPSTFYGPSNQTTATTHEREPSQPHGGCIPFLGVYLSDLLYNTELPSFVEPKVTSFNSAYPYGGHCPQAETSHLPSPPQSATSPPLHAGVGNSYYVDPSPAVPSSSCASTSTPTKTVFPLSSSSSSPLPPMVNLHKHRTIATIIKRILTFRTMASRYPFVKDADVYDQLMAIEDVDQAEMERLSELCEEKASTASSSALASPVFAK